MNNMDEIFRDRLKDHEVSVPAGMWEEIELALPKGSKRKRGIFWYSLAGILSILLCSGLFFGYQFFKQSNQRLIDSQDILHAQIDNNTNGSSERSDAMENQQLLDTQVQDEHQTINPNSDTHSTEASFTTDVNTLLETTDLDANLTSNESNGIENSLENSALNATLNTPIQDVGLVNNGRLFNKEIVLNAIDKIVEGVQESRIMQEVLLLKNKQVFLDNHIHQVATPNPQTDCPKFNQSKSYFSVSAYHSSDLNFKTLTSDSQEIREGYLQDRIVTEKALYSFSDGFKMTFHSGYRFNIGTGLEYNQITERFTYENEDARKVKTVITIDTVYQPNGSYTTSVDTYRIEVQGVEVNKITNRYKSIDIPVYVQYEIPGKMLDVVISAGVNINIYKDQTGRILGENKEPIFIHSGTIDGDNIFVPRTGLKYEVSAGFYYHLSNHLDVMIEPYFRGNSSSITRSSYAIDQNYKTLGLRTGISYKLGN